MILVDSNLPMHLLGVSSLSSRDAIHVAIMQRYSIGRVMSFDRDLDGVPGIDRLF